MTIAPSLGNEGIPPTRYGDVAKQLTANGYQVVPIRPGKKRPPMKAWQDYLFTTQSLNEYSDHGCGILCGPVAAIDIDILDPVLANAVAAMAFEMLKVEGVVPWRIGMAPKMLIPVRVTGTEFAKVQTASFALRSMPDAKTSKVEILARGQQFVAYGVHPDTNAPYIWHDGRGLEQVPVSLLPAITEGIANELVERAGAMLQAAGAARAVKRARNNFAAGGRNSALYKVGIAMAGRGHLSETILAELLRVNAAECRPPLDDAEVRSIASSAANSQAAATSVTATQQAHPDGLSSEPYSHAHLAADFLERHGPDVRYLYDRDTWLVWDGTRWKRDDAQNVFSLFNELAHEHAHRARKDSINGTKLVQRARVARSVESAAHRAGGEAIARRNPAVTLPIAFLDQNPCLLNTPAGVIDLRTGQTQSHRRDDLITKITNVSPSTATPIRFMQFLQEIALEDESLIDYLRMALGACLFGASALSGDHWLLFLHGCGRNGKNTLLDTIVWLMGDYAKQVPSQLLMADTHGNRHPTEIANLQGVRLALSSEIDEGSRWAESQIKALTGDALLAGRFMGQNFFEFARTHRHIILGNHRPILASTDRAMRERLHLVPFVADFSKSADPTLGATLRGEAGGVMTWLLHGAVDYWKIGKLPKCASVEHSTSDYFDSQSTFDDWIAECVTSQPGGRTPAKELYASFRAWKEARGEGVPSQTRWGEEMRKRYTAYKSGAVRGYEHIAVR
jgi:P4 family phage/plasmid primase-like protien